MEEVDLLTTGNELWVILPKGVDGLPIDYPEAFPEDFLEQWPDHCKSEADKEAENEVKSSPDEIKSWLSYLKV